MNDKSTFLAVDAFEVGCDLYTCLCAIVKVEVPYFLEGQFPRLSVASLRISAAH